jgi:O-antigen ligase
MTRVVATTWAELGRQWILHPGRAEALKWALTIGLPLLLWISPWPTLALVAGFVLLAWFWRDASAPVLLIIALMGNSKLHYYAGGITVFPEYPILLLATLVAVLQTLEGRPWPGERHLLLLFGCFVFAGLVSFPNAMVLGRVFTKWGVVLITLITFVLILRGVSTERELGRAMRWVVASTAVVAVYSVLQVVAPLAGFNVNLDFMEKYGNPDFYYGIGAPVIFQFTKIFRANGFFNDSNILAGFIAALSPVVLALAAHDAATRRRGAAVAGTAVLFLLMLGMIFTLSRSGVVALAAGVGVVLLCMPRIVRSPVAWVGGAFIVVMAIMLSASFGVDPIVLWIRLGETFNLGDFSNKQHMAAADFAVSLFARFPITGAGLRQFGYYYAADVDPRYDNMIAHNAFLGYFAETGLLGGIPFVLLIGAILWRSISTVGDRRLRTVAPQLHAWNVGLLGSLVALTVSNCFYDFYLRTFAWVLSALAVVATRLWRTRAALLDADPHGGAG